MKKIVRLTESDLIRLVKRVINEQQSMDNFPADVNKPQKLPDTLKGTNWEARLFQGIPLSVYDGQMIYNTLIKKGYTGYIQPIYLDDRSLIKQGQLLPGTTNVAAPTDMLRPAFKVLRPFEIGLPGGQLMQPRINGFLNTCDQRIENCPMNITKSVEVKIGNDKFIIDLAFKAN